MSGKTGLNSIYEIFSRSLKEFGRLISAIEDEKERMLDQAQQFIVPLENFRKVSCKTFLKRTSYEL